MAIITLTTDFGAQDFLVASMKGRLLAQPNIQVVDITHGISPFHIAEASYVLKNAYHHFIRGSIHIIGVDALPHQRFIAAEIDGHFFICSDNGLLSLLCRDQKPTQTVVIKEAGEKRDLIFPSRDIFVPTALAIAQGKPLSTLGANTQEIKKSAVINPVEKNNQLIGTVIYIDHFENVICNIDRRKFEEVAQGRKFEISFRGQTFTDIHESYSGIVKNPEEEINYHGRGMALFNSADFLEIAVYKSKPDSFGSAKSLYRLNYGDQIVVEFKN